MVELRDVVKNYLVGGTPIYAIDHVSMTVAAGELVALYGPSGSGKTTLIELIAGLQTPDSGSIRVGEREVAQMSRKEARHYRLHELGIVMNPNSLQPGARAITSAALKLMSSGAHEPYKRITPLMVELGLGDRLRHRVAELSMGERQRVLLALALSCGPRLVLADEPTASLDTENTQSVLCLLRRLCRERDMALLLVTHDPEAAGYADRVHELRDGRLGDRRPSLGQRDGHSRIGECERA
ncbi:MAG TPA: ATP-binding cassette domain-containing protein [Solirubrobacteraceae bacterium]|nr:ATP-binding cassette domain-containing protein [Solirubrobacteraceae bacterium]